VQRGDFATVAGVRSSAPITTIAALACCLASCGEKPTPAARTVAPSQLKITTTLDGRRVLPQRSRWLAHPSAPPAQIADVEFLIDGRLRAVDHRPPYNYGSDDRNGHPGWLVTSRLKPGAHRFTARARLTDGQTASDTVIARVNRPLAPPDALTGSRWHPNVSAAAITCGDGSISAGPRALLTDHTGLQDLGPQGSGIVEHVIVPPPECALSPRPDAAPHRRRPSEPQAPRPRRHRLGLHEDGPPATHQSSLTGDALPLSRGGQSSDSRRAPRTGT
jgi:hypothetical protein